MIATAVPWYYAQIKLDGRKQTMITRRSLLVTAATAATAVAMPNVVRAKPTKLKLSHYLPPQHQINKEFHRWADELRKKTDGQLDIQIYPAGQMGPPPRQFDLARTGVADLAYVFTALVPGRFPMTDMLSAPFLFAHDDGMPISTADASVIGTNLRGMLAHEYAGTEILYSVVATSVGFFMRERLVRTPNDLKGLRIRPTSTVVASHLRAWGASPTTIAPPELADAIAKGVVDGAIFNFEGGKVFQLQQSVKKVSLMAEFSRLLHACHEQQRAQGPAERDATGHRRNHRTCGRPPGRRPLRRQ